jgi:hypothetical protein
MSFIGRWILGIGRAREKSKEIAPPDVKRRDKSGDAKRAREQEEVLDGMNRNFSDRMVGLSADEKTQVK